MGQKLILTHLRTVEERPCSVVCVGRVEMGTVATGVEFGQPAPRFCQIAFPPEYWDPVERKHPLAHSR